MWNLGTSASVGTYLRSSAESSLYGGYHFDDYRQIVVAQDASFAWHHLQLWAEIFAARFTIPDSDDAETTAYYLEAKYKFTPRLFGAIRWNHQLFGRIRNMAGERVEWGREIQRIDIAPTFRFSAHTQLKFQYSVQHERLRPKDYAHTIGLQFTVRF
jgi:hypothetical protein